MQQSSCMWPKNHLRSNMDPDLWFSGCPSSVMSFLVNFTILISAWVAILSRLELCWNSVLIAKNSGKPHWLGGWQTLVEGHSMGNPREIHGNRFGEWEINFGTSPVMIFIYFHRKSMDQSFSHLGGSIGSIQPKEKCGWAPENLHILQI